MSGCGDVSGARPAWPGARETASPELGNNVKIRNLNDGRYGETSIWLSGAPGKGWLMVEFPRIAEIDRVVWGRDRTGKLRGRRQIMMDDSDVPWHRHAKGAVGGVAAAAIGDPAVFVSVDAMHQGPQGGGPVIAIIDAGE